MKLDGAARRALDHLRSGIPLEEALRRACEPEGERAREAEVALRGLLSDLGSRGQGPEAVLERVARGSVLGAMRDPGTYRDPDEARKRSGRIRQKPI